MTPHRPSLRVSRAAWPVLAVALLAALSACSPAPSSAFQGYVEGEFVYMASSQAGQLTRLAVERGQTVQAAAPLFALESGNEIAGLRQAAHQLAVAQAQQADLLTGKRPPEIDVTQAQLDQARVEADRSATQAARDEKQWRAGGIAASQRDDSRAAAAQAGDHVRELERQLAVARLPGREQQIRAAAEGVHAAQAALAQAQWRLDQKSVKAAHDGLVFDTLYRPGEWVPAGSPVVRMLPPENVKVRFFVQETAVGALRTGQHVTLHCDGCRSAVPAVITFVADEAEYTPPVIYSNEARQKLVFLVEARPRPADAPRLHPGQPVTVDLS